MADLDGDGDDDILTVQRGTDVWSLTSFINGGDGLLTGGAPFGSGDPVAVVDLDGDGVPDLAEREGATRAPGCGGTVPV